MPEDDIIGWRRWLHQHPELSYQEHETAQFVEEKLNSFGHIEVTRPTPTSVVGVLRGTGGPGKTIALRADLDALPVQEETGLPFASERAGVMHACGHDTHTAMLLGAAQTLSGLRERLHGTVKFIFQHAEEVPPGGAQAIVDAGVLDDVDAVFGLHIMNQPGGTIQVVRGVATTSADGFWLTIQGRGAHGSMPQDSIDPVIVGTQVVTGLNTIVSRSVDPNQMVVVSVGVFQAGEAPNVIPDIARLGVSIRTKRQEDRDLVRRRADEIVQHTCQAHGASYRIDWVQGYAPVVNDDHLCDLALQAAQKAIGEDKVSEGVALSGSEDFSAYLQKAPGCFVFLGGGTAADGLPYVNHHPKFDSLESTYASGTRYHVQLVLDMLGDQGTASGMG